ncbi:MAG: Gfo/Idh/MocA family oxidoreductase [Zavarzinella sp.]
MTTAFKPVKLGILGVARINHRLKPAFDQCEQIQLQAIASRSMERAKAASKELGIAKPYGSYEDLLADPEIEAVYIPLPNALHGDWVKRAADHGKHILCEKPLCPTAAEALEVVEYCRTKNVKLMDGFMWPHHPRTKKMRAMIDQGSIGQVLRTVTSFTFMMEELKTSEIRLQPEMAGGGLGDVGCYCIYGIRWAMQAEPVSVWARANWFNDVDVDMCGVLTFADGRTAQFDCGFARPLRMNMEIVGSTGVISLPDMWIPTDDAADFNIIRNPGGFEFTSENHPNPGADQMVNMLTEFATAIRENREPTPSPMEAVKSLRVMDALLHSAREKREIEITA